MCYNEDVHLKISVQNWKRKKTR